ncbi:hypothetical protein CPB84DRAFT_1790828 [Gymnopilus junonius]|uniref:Ndc10 domain-containing protein n=1 Tax=Gymnopilus junonius TaxID=109634 RepID=A0A9P5NFL1_GYMJU|nr:hypothetical protein CPB84DRAFT_1790828 [Gymnopilus junonius]
MSAVGFYFYSHFHILAKERPIFFSGAIDRPYGQVEWHKMSLFPGQTDEKKPLTKTHFNSILNTYCNGVAGPHSLANQKDTITRWELYNQNRHLSNPPSELLDYLFPWVDQEISNCCKRMGKYGEKAMDDSLLGFLGLLKYLRLIIIQDATILFLKYPDSPIFTKPPFSFSSFRRFAEASKASMSHPHSQTLMQPTDLTKERSSSISSITEGMLDILDAVDKDAKCVRPLLAQLSAAGSPLDRKRISRGKNNSRRSSDYEDIRSPFTTPLFANS